jgi:competence protein ComEC
VARSLQSGGGVKVRCHVDGVLLVALAAGAGGLAYVAPISASTTAVVVLVVVARGGRPAVALLASLVFLLSAWRAERAVTTYERGRAAAASSAWPSRCTLEGTVARSPSRLGDALRVDLDVDQGSCEHGAARGRVTLHVPLEAARLAENAARGDRVSAIAQLAPPYLFWNPGTGDPRPGRARRGVVLTGGADDLVVVSRAWSPGALVDRARAHLRARILATFPPRTEGMARALVLGESDVDPDDQHAFRRSGLAHLLAVSGMHLVLVVAGAVVALRALLVRLPAVGERIVPGRAAAAVGVPLAWLYADVAGGSGSAVRAAWMTSAALAAHALARRPSAWRAFALSIGGMMATDPLAAYDASFTLSASATGGLIALARPAERALAALLPRAPLLVTRPLSTSAAASIACAPALASMSSDLPLVGLVANVVAVPLGEALALPLCLVHAVLAPLPAVERGCALAAGGALEVVRLIAHAAASVPWGALPAPPPLPAQIGALAVLAFGLTMRRPLRWALAAASVVVAAEIAARAEGAPRGVLRVTFLDVGQGDAALVDLPDGRAILIDGGGLVGSPIDTGARVIAPVLRARRRDRVDLAILSHPHPDHFLGLPAGLAGVAVGALWDTGQGEAEEVGGSYAEMLAAFRSRGVPVLDARTACGVRRLGGAVIEVLAPCPEISADRGPNDNSFVVRIRYGTRAVLFVGDAEREEEEDLVQSNGTRLRADVLKVGHHGSRTSSSPAFLARVGAAHAVISCGVRNRFGHPHPKALLSIARAGPRVHRTDLDGAVIVTTDGTSLDVRSMRSGP